MMDMTIESYRRSNFECNRIPSSSFSTRTLLELGEEDGERWSCGICSLERQALRFKHMGSCQDGFVTQRRDIDMAWTEVCGFAMSSIGNGKIEMPVELVRDQNSLG